MVSRCKLIKTKLNKLKQQFMFFVCIYCTYTYFSCTPFVTLTLIASVHSLLDNWTPTWFDLVIKFHFTLQSPTASSWTLNHCLRASSVANKTSDPVAICFTVVSSQRDAKKTVDNDRTFHRVSIARFDSRLSIRRLLGVDNENMLLFGRHRNEHTVNSKITKERRKIPGIVSS